MRSSPTTTSKPKASFLSSTAIVMGAFVLSRVLGLIRDSIWGSAFGTSAEMDAFRAASTVTDTLYYLVAGGALGSAFIPTFTAYLARGERKVGWRVASAVVNLVFLVTLIASILALILAPWLVSTLLAPGYDDAAQLLTVKLLRWMVASTVIFSVSGLLMGILNANDHFLLPALAPSMYNLGIIGGVLLLRKPFGIYGAAIGTVAGALLHLLIQLPGLRGTDWRYSPILGLRLEGVRQVGRLMGPRVLGMAITQLNFWVNVNLGSRIGVEGVVSALNLGFRLMLLPQGVFAQAIATVLFPSFSAQVARQERGDFQRTVRSALQMVFYLTLPATLGMILLAGPLVQVFFMRGVFDDRAVQMVAWALGWYAVGLVAHSELEIVTRAFYALHDTATPVWVGGGAMALNVLLSLLFRWLFEGFGTRYAGYASWMPMGGLALANSVATILETLALGWILCRRLKRQVHSRVRASLWRTIVGAVVMGGVLIAFLRLVPSQNPWVLGGGGIAVGGGAFLLLTLLLRSPELEFVLDAVRSRWSR